MFRRPDRGGTNGANGGATGWWPARSRQAVQGLGLPGRGAFTASRRACKAPIPLPAVLFVTGQDHECSRLSDRLRDAVGGSCHEEKVPDRCPYDDHSR